MLYYTIECELCGDIDKLADSCDTPNRAFTEMGWRETPYGNICPNCMEDDAVIWTMHKTTLEDLAAESKPVTRF